MLSPGCDVTLTLFNMTFVAQLVNHFTTTEKSFSATPDYFSKIYSRSLLQCVWYLGQQLGILYGACAKFSAQYWGKGVKSNMVAYE